MSVGFSNFVVVSVFVVIPVFCFLWLCRCSCYCRFLYLCRFCCLYICCCRCLCLCHFLCVCRRLCLCSRLFICLSVSLCLYRIRSYTLSNFQRPSVTPKNTYPPFNSHLLCVYRGLRSPVRSTMRTIYRKLLRFSRGLCTVASPWHKDSVPKLKPICLADFPTFIGKLCHIEWTFRTLWSFSAFDYYENRIAMKETVTPMPAFFRLCRYENTKIVSLNLMMYRLNHFLLRGFSDMRRRWVFGMR